MRKFRYLLSISGSLMILAQIAAAQSPQPVTQPHSSQVSVLVTDKAGNPVTDLRQEDFLLFEDGKSKTNATVLRKDEPISFGLIVDATGSMRTQFAFVLDSARRIVNALRPGDEAFLAIVREGQTNIVVDWTSDKRQLLAPLATLIAKGGGSVMNSLHTSGEYLTKHTANIPPSARRRALVIITDGEEGGTRYGVHHLQKYLEQEHIQVLAISLYRSLGVDVADLFSRTDRENADYLLRQITASTAGRVFFPKSSDHLQRIASEILNYQRSRYVISYDSLPPDSKGKIRVKLAEGPGRDKYSVMVVAQSN